MQDTGKVGWSAQGAPAHTWATTLLQWSPLLLCVTYLVSTSIGGLTPVARRVSHWASARHKPALSIVVMARLAWTGHGQDQWLWAGMQVLVCRQALRLHPAIGWLPLFASNLVLCLQPSRQPENQIFV